MPFHRIPPAWDYRRWPELPIGTIILDNGFRIPALKQCDQHLCPYRVPEHNCPCAVPHHEFVRDECFEVKCGEECCGTCSIKED